MMSNPFDQFDQPATTNPFDQFDQPTQAAPRKGRTIAEDFGQGAVNLLSGAVRGAGSIGATILSPFDIARDALNGKGLSLDSNRQRRRDMDDGLQNLVGAEPESLAYKGGKLAGEVAGTAGAGGVLANGASRLGAAPSLVSALSTSGMRAGGATGAAGMGLRTVGGAAAGGASAGLVNPEDAGLGALIGGGLPLALRGAGKVGSAVGGFIKGPAPSAGLQAQIAAARQAGYVIPPTQAKPSLVNRTLEGFSGKITTAQNASARNQEVTNELAKKAIGASDLSPAGLQEVRKRANSAYDALGQAGAFQADDVFGAALDAAGSSSAAMRQNFPGLVNGEVDNMIATLKTSQQFDAQPTIEAIKQFRANASVMKRSDDPARVAMGKAQNKIASALENLVDRNLQQAGNPELLQSYRAARQVLAKTYDVEKALNVSGNIDAKKLTQALKKGRPLTDELKTIAEFAGRFPKAAQAMEGMGSLPQTSPLDFAAAGTMSAATANPLMMATVAARPAARALTLSNVVQNRLQPGMPGYLERLLEDQRTRQLLYRTAPVLGRD